MLTQADTTTREMLLLLQNIFDATQDAIIVVDEDQNILMFNRAAEIMFACPASDAIGQSVTRFIPAEVRERHTQYVQALGKEKGPNRTRKDLPLSAACLRADGTSFPTDISIAEFDIEGHKRYAAIIRDVTERVQAEEKKHQQMKRLKMLYHSGLAFAQILDQKTVAEKIIAILEEHLDWHHAAVRVRHNDEIKLLAFSQSSSETQSFDQAQNLLSANSHGLANWVMEHGETVRSDNVEADPRYRQTFAGMKSGLYVPMKIRDNTIGCISIESEQPDAFTEEDEQLISTLAAQAAIAMENARLFEQLNRRLEQVSGLHAIDIAISSATDLSVILEITLDRIVHLLGVDAAAIYLYDPILQKLEFKKSKGFHSQEGTAFSIRLGEGPIGQAALERKKIYTPGNLIEQVSPVRRAVVEREQFQVSICVPLIAKHQIKGVLEILNRTPLGLDNEWKDFLNVLAGQTAIAIDNAQLFENLQRTNLELAVSYDATIEGWSRAMSMRDLETEEHIQRVTELGMQLAELMGLSSETLVYIRRGALLHDIGKIAIPDAILRKAGPLNEEEWQIVRKHPQYARDLLVNIPYLRSAIDIPYCHHEKWDGSGYPRGLKGEQIPLAARIFAVVDVYDALTSNRPYRSAWPPEKALAYIQEQAGTHFDPQVVEVFLKWMSNLL